MRRYEKTLVVASILVAGLAAAPALYAHDSHGSSGSMMGPGGMMGQGGMMGRGMMGQGRMMGPGMIAPGMMGPGMGDRGMMMDRGMMGHDFGERVVPSRHLSTDDVRHFFEHRLARRENKRLKLGEVKEQNDDSIVAEIVTVDDSLVERLEVDRHTGLMQQID